MEKLEIDQKVENGKLVLELPEEFNNSRVHVTVSKVSGNAEMQDHRKWSEIPVDERLQILNGYKGSAKYPDFPIDKYDVYEQ